METNKAYNLGETNLRQKLWILTFLQAFEKYPVSTAITEADNAVEAFEKKFGQVN